jgi:uncharacterized protein YbjT (DUF2867 family)
VRFLADESCDVAVVRALRAAGHDVAAIAEEQPGLTDRDVIARASLGADVVQLVETLGDRLLRSFVTAEPGRARITRLPGPG